MKMPNAHLAVVDREKILDYLLNEAHPDNGGKALFFIALGFNREHWEMLASALRQLAQAHAVTNMVASSHGQKYIIDGQIETSGEKSPVVRTVWIVDLGSDRPRLVTAYPHKA